MSSSKFLIGCDPEWFLQNSDGLPISAIGKFSGTKDEPVQLERGVSVQVDNCAVEYGIKPATSEAEWVDLNLAAREQISEIAASMGLKLLIVPSVQFSRDELDDPRAWVFGCEPDLNAWTLEWNRSPKCDDPSLRSGGGHGHLGLTMDQAQAHFYARAMDAYIAVPGMLVDTDDRRRLLYGKAGAMRYKPYGLEWRTASNFWTTTEERIRWFYRAMSAAVESVTKGWQVPIQVREVIDTGDRVGAAFLCQKYGLEVPQ